MSTIVILDNIRSAHNVGSIFRSADGAGVEKIYLVGTTPGPIDRFGRTQPEIAKTSLGATESVAWELVGEPTGQGGGEAVRLIARLRSAGYSIVAVEQTATSIPLREYIAPEKVVYIFGAEVEGVQPVLLQAADTVIAIPMHGQKESLNVSVTAGIVLFS